MILVFKISLNIFLCWSVILLGDAGKLFSLNDQSISFLVLINVLFRNLYRMTSLMAIVLSTQLSRLHTAGAYSDSLRQGAKGCSSTTSDVVDKSQGFAVLEGSL